MSQPQYYDAHAIGSNIVPTCCLVASCIIAFIKAQLETWLVLVRAVTIRGLLLAGEGTKYGLKEQLEEKWKKQMELESIGEFNSTAKLSYRQVIIMHV